LIAVPPSDRHRSGLNLGVTTLNVCPLLHGIPGRRLKLFSHVVQAAAALGTSVRMLLCHLPVIVLWLFLKHLPALEANPVLLVTSSLAEAGSHSARALCYCERPNIGHPKLFMGGEESAARSFAAASGE
jgi:hypothetical protein